MQNKRIVIKIGTNSIMADPTTVATGRLEKLAEIVHQLLSLDNEVLIVTSGAVGLGRNSLGLSGHLSITEKQACASIGQSVLMHTYQSIFQKYQRVCGQVLLTSRDLENRKTYLCLRDTLEALLKKNVIPILNENDCISTAEILSTSGKSFGDNDKLSSIIASKLNADLLIILSDVSGVYNRNPKVSNTAQKLKVVFDIKEFEKVDAAGSSEFGRGGMVSKLDAIRKAYVSGVPVLIASGFEVEKLSILFDQEDVLKLGDIGTIVVPKSKMSSKKKWIGLASGFKGILVLNHGAVTALKERGASLLASGVVDLKGKFSKDVVVSIHDESGQEIGRGLVSYSSSDLKKILGKKSSEIVELLKNKKAKEVIHRDQLVIF